MKPKPTSNNHIKAEYESDKTFEISTSDQFENQQEQQEMVSRRKRKSIVNIFILINKFVNIFTDILNFEES
jgi:hypothetical protein